MTDWRELTAYMPPRQIAEALDDDGDGLPDEGAWAAVARGAEDRLRAIFGPAGVPPSLDALAEHARRLFALSLLYARRGLGGDDDPFADEARRAEDRLKALAQGDESTDGALAEPVVIGEPAKFAGTGGLMA